MADYITKKEYGNLVGKRARFKENLSGYVRSAHGKVGTIMQHKGVEHVGLSLRFDKPIKAGYGGSIVTKSLYMAPDSFVLLKEKKRKR